MIIRHALLELTTSPKSKQSSIILNNEIIITPATILKTLQKSQINLIEENLTDSKKIIKVQENNEFEFLKLLKFEVTFDQKSNYEENSIRTLTRYRAKLLYLYNCKKIRECIKKIHEKLNPIDNFIPQILLSNFIILNIVEQTQSIQKSPNIYDFSQSAIAYCKLLNPISKLDDVMTICTPFGLENFYKTVNIGKISNILDNNNCIFIISNTLPHGCEGSAILNNKLRLIGILICTTLQKQNEKFSLCLAGNFQYIIKEFINQYGIQFGTTMGLPLTRQPSKWDKSLVIIKTATNQGTGSFVKILNKKFVLTCTHVLAQDDFITCRYIDGNFTPKVIWKNRKYNAPFDIALLSVPLNITDDYCLNLSGRKPYLGQSIYNAGFSFFTNMDETAVAKFTPSRFDGRIIKYSTGLLISDVKLQAGQSGGPIFDENGSILGVCVSNFKLHQTIYPNINTSVPIYDIKHILEKYAKTNDHKVLNDLIASPAIQKKWALEKPFVNCKL